MAVHGGGEHTTWSQGSYSIPWHFMRVVGGTHGSGVKARQQALVAVELLDDPFSLGGTGLVDAIVPYRAIAASGGTPRRFALRAPLLFAGDSLGGLLDKLPPTGDISRAWCFPSNSGHAAKPCRIITQATEHAALTQRYNEGHTSCFVYHGQHTSVPHGQRVRHTWNGQHTKNLSWNTHHFYPSLAPWIGDNFAPSALLTVSRPLLASGLLARKVTNVP